ncbi:MAG TPA: N-methyl-L-tryptophan oxidase [Alphaproteobacteria bacterium]|nr:N-methyl-L-tryptophan oxidase [Alphaproteobacteria bacterium]
MTVYDVAVVGLGAMGSAALYHLARRGKRIIGFERETPAHLGGSSHGESRIIRLAYFEHSSYVPLLRRAYENWRALESGSGAKLLTVTGILEAGIPGSAVVQGSLAASRLHDLPHEMLTARAIMDRFPATSLPSDWEGVFQPDAGFLRPEKAIDTHIAGAKAAGAEVRLNTAVSAIEPTAGGVRLTLVDGTAIEAGAAVVSAGAWVGELIPELRPHLRLTRQVIGWFAPKAPELVGPTRLPVFMLEDADGMVYGFPDFAGTGVKVGFHGPGRLWNSADEARQDADKEDTDRLADFLGRYMPAAAGPAREAKTCIYTRTPDEDFIVDRHPDHPQIVIASPCSGHGFKFASVVGEITADLATAGQTRHDISRFAMGRLA